MCAVIPRILFYPTLGYTVLVSKISSRNWYNRVDETVVIGALPFKKISQKLIDEENVRAVLTLNESYELKHTYTTKEWAEVGVKQMRLSTVDLIGTAPINRLKLGVDFILSHRDKGENVYVHCKAGRTRSAMYVVCYLMEINKWDPDEAYEHLKLKRPHVWLRKLQFDSVKNYYDTYVKDGDKEES